jgi:glycosyltransferase involved in cell wall biosynthesis
MSRSWSINGRFLTQPLSGVQRYAEEIVKALDALIVEGHPHARDLSVELLVPPGLARPLPLQAISVRRVGRTGGHSWEQLALPIAPRGGLLSLGNAGPVAARKHIVCIHDVNTRLAPASYSAQFRTLYRILLPALGRSAARVATVSHFSADQIAGFGIARKAKMAVIPNGHEHALAWTPQHSMVTEKASGPNTIFVIGSPAPHKNVSMLLNMADQLAAAGLQLAIAGKADPHVFASGAPRFDAPNVHWLGAITDGELAALLGDCLCLAFPSFTEGFGLPALEAMARGCPVVSSDRASLPEVCGEAALYAAPTEPAAWLAHFKRLKADADLRAGLIAKGFVQARRFRWNKSAALYLLLMARLDGVEHAPESLRASVLVGDKG